MAKSLAIPATMNTKKANRWAAKLVGVAAGIALLLTTSHSAFAQREGGRGGAGRGGPGIASPIFLLSNEQVQQELQLTNEQQQQLETLRDEFRSEARTRGGQERGRGQREAREQRAAETASKLADILTDDQQQRLAGILIQVDLGAALGNPYVVEQLGLTDEQRTKLSEAQDANRRAMREARDELADGSREERMAKMAELRETAHKNLTDVLTTEQQAKLDELKGAPVEINFRGFGGGAGRGRRAATN